MRQSRGSVPVGGDAWWSATLSAPVGDAARDAGLVVLRIERLGPPAAGTPRALGAELLVAAGEIEAIPALLAGVVAQAWRDGVLRRPGVARGDSANDVG